MVRVKSERVESMKCDERPGSWAYVIPTTDTCILGSVDTVDNWSTRPEPGDREKILRRCDLLFPGIKVDEELTL